MKRPWPNIVVLWLVGVLAAAQLAKFAILAPNLRSAFSLSLAGIGLLISLLEIGGALFGFVAGMALARVGSRRFPLAGLTILALTGGAEALARDVATLFVARAIEGIGYVLVVIAAPTIIAGMAADRDRPAALALWSTFVAVGVAIGGVVTSTALNFAGSAGALLLWPGISILGIMIVARAPIVEVSGQGKVQLAKLGAWLSTLGFGCYTMFVCALTMLLPIFLMERAGVSIGIASIAAGMVSIAALPGSAIAIYITRRIALDRRSVARVVTPALLMTATIAPFVFLLPGGINIGFICSTGLAGLAVMLSGIASPILFGRLPVLAGARDATDRRIASANGLLTQFGAGGALIGPPLGGLVVEHWGWSSLGFAIAVLALVMLTLIVCAEAAADRGTILVHHNA